MSVLPKKPPAAGAVRQSWLGAGGGSERRPPATGGAGVDGRADGGVAAVADRGGELAGGDGVVVVTQELGCQVVGAGPTAVADRPPCRVLNAPTAPVARVTLAWRTTPRDLAGWRWWSARIQMGVVDQVHIRPLAEMATAAKWPDRPPRRRPPWRCSCPRRWSTTPPRPAPGWSPGRRRPRSSRSGRWHQPRWGRRRRYQCWGTLARGRR